MRGEINPREPHEQSHKFLVQISHPISAWLTELCPCDRCREARRQVLALVLETYLERLFAERDFLGIKPTGKHLSVTVTREP